MFASYRRCLFAPTWDQPSREGLLMWLMRVPNRFLGNSEPLPCPIRLHFDKLRVFSSRMGHANFGCLGLRNESGHVYSVPVARHEVRVFPMSQATKWGTTKNHSPLLFKFLHMFVWANMKSAFPWRVADVTDACAKSVSWQLWVIALSNQMPLW